MDYCDIEWFALEMNSDHSVKKQTIWCVEGGKNYGEK